MAGKTYNLKFNFSDGSSQDVQFTAPQGPQGEQGEKGANGEDYVLTDADKQEIAEIVKSENNFAIYGITVVTSEEYAALVEAGKVEEGVIYMIASDTA